MSLNKYKAISLDAANAVLQDELVAKHKALDDLIAPRHGESDRAFPSMAMVREVSIGKLKTQIKSIKRAIRINRYVMETMTNER